MIVLIALIAVAIAAAYLFMHQPQFGGTPEGARLERIVKSPQYRDGAFQNQSATPALSKDAGVWKMLSQQMNKPADNVPPEPLPSVSTDLRHFHSEKPSVVWFGHSSYLLYIDGKKILVDPVFSGYASPVSFFVKAYKGTEVYDQEKMPDTDVILITHDHYDHLDYKTITALKDRTKRFICPLGVGAHLEYWGIPSDKITELDWWDTTFLDNGFSITAAPARHFSGRRFKRNQTLWASYVLKTNTHNLYLGGDSGYDTHFKKIGEKYGPFDLAVLECGQYGRYWPYIHMFPPEIIKAFTDLEATVLLPVHWAKFSLSVHSWTEPIEQVTSLAYQKEVKVSTPMIGEPLILDSIYPEKKWWRQNQAVSIP